MGQVKSVTFQTLLGTGGSAAEVSQTLLPSGWEESCLDIVLPHLEGKTPVI